MDQLLYGWTTHCRSSSPRALPAGSPQADRDPASDAAIRPDGSGSYIGQLRLVLMFAVRRELPELKTTVHEIDSDVRHLSPAGSLVLGEGLRCASDEL